MCPTVASVAAMHGALSASLASRYFRLIRPAPSTMALPRRARRGMNPQLAAWKHAPSRRKSSNTIARSGERFGYNPRETDGTFASGGSEANQPRYSRDHREISGVADARVRAETAAGALRVGNASIFTKFARLTGSVSARARNSRERRSAKDVARLKHRCAKTGSRARPF